MSEVEYGALAGIQEMIARVARGEALFPATEVFNEGWMLRLNLPGSCGGSVPWEGWSYAKTWEIPGRAA